MKLNFRNLKTAFIIVFLLLSFSTFSQVKNDTIRTTNIDSTNIKVEKKLRFGTGFGLNFVGGTNIGFSPNLTYNFNKNLALGFGVQFNYNSIKEVQSTTSYGANSIFEYKPLLTIMTMLEFALLRVESKSDIDNSKRNFWDAALFIGAGYFITKKISLGAKYNVLYDEDESIYASPIIPFINIGF
tara:strand:+ start:190 stop:744 length:555 start_codon:yes stop_codon:yes gene_type:complete